MSQTLYLWLKAVHIIAMVAWMAGLFYLPRLFVYHADAGIGSTSSETFKVMERRLMAAIMRPAMVVTIAAGVWLVIEGSWFSPVAGWLAMKIGLVTLLVGYHLLLEFHLRRYLVDDRSHGPRYFRIINEVPTLLLIGIVALAVLKP